MLQGTRNRSNLSTYTIIGNLNTTMNYIFARQSFARSRNIFCHVVTTNGQPAGTLHPTSWCLPMKAGGLSCFLGAQGAGYFLPTGNMGVNGSTTIIGTGGITSDLSLVVILIATMYGEGHINPAYIASALEGYATLYGQGTMSPATLGALIGLNGICQGSAMLNVILSATASLSADITPFTDLSPQSLAKQVWASNITDNISAGSMGNLLYSAGGGSSPEVIAAAVWDKLCADHIANGTFGEFIQTVLTTTKFMGLK